jgi:hypothetical protein
MKLKEILEVLAWAPEVIDDKNNTLYEPRGYYVKSPLEYDDMVVKYGDYEVDEISAGHDCTLIVKLKEN